MLDAVMKVDPEYPGLALEQHQAGCGRRGLEGFAVGFENAIGAGGDGDTCGLGGGAGGFFVACIIHHEIKAEFREFERFSTAAVNASLMPIMDRTMTQFEQGVAALGIRNRPRVMQSNGGAVSPGAVRKMPAHGGPGRKVMRGK